MFRLFILFILTGCFLTAEDKAPVVCIHGFMGSSWNLHYVKKKLKKAGWNALDWDYPSMERFIEDHAEDLVSDLNELANKQPNQPIHFVTHSMGGLVLLAALNDPACPEEAKIGRVVLLAPPLGGSRWGRQVGEFKIARWLLKDFSGKELITKKNFDDLGEFPGSLQGVLVIAGDRSINPFFRQGDGTLAIDETVLATPHEHVIVHESHLTILVSKKACRLINHFLEDGTAD